VEVGVAQEVSPVSAAPTKAEKESGLKRLRSRLEKSSSQLGKGIGEIFTHGKLDDEALEAFEELLIMADMGVEAASDIAADLAKTKFDKQVNEADIKSFLAEKVTDILAPVTRPLT